MAEEVKETKEVKKSNKTPIIIGSIVGAVIIAAAVVLCVLLLGKGNVPTTMEQLKTAFKEKKALNCVFSVPDSGKATIQTDDGWNKLKFSGDMEDVSKSTILITGKTAYMWMGDGSGMAIKTTKNKDDYMEIFKVPEDKDDEEAKDVSFKCDSPSKADFSVPKNINFIDADAYNLDFGDFDYDNYDYDSDYDYDDDDSILDWDF